MTKQQALELEKRCEKLLSDRLGSDVTLSISVRGDLVVRSSINWISVSLPSYAVAWVHFDGFYGDLVRYVNDVIDVIRKNANDFVELLWAYKLKEKLDDSQK